MRPRSYVLSLLILMATGVGLQAQDRAIRGTVVDSVSGEPVDFPQVSVQGTDLGALGDASGSFVISDAPAGELVLTVRRIGYKSKDVPVPAGQGQVDVQLVTDYLQVEELVVTGRATAVQRQNLAHAVATVSGEEVSRVPQQTIDRALQGKVAGAVISQNSGAPGGGQQIQLRGTASINAASQPLYVIDGVIVSNEAIQPNTNEITGATSGSNPTLNQDNASNRIADINPQDIESVEILKGASAAAIYGSKASNGVVIITTKRGREGESSLRLSGQAGFFDLSNTLGSRTWTQSEAVGQFGEGVADLFTGQTFDNEEALAGRNDPSWELSGSMTGGTSDLRYFGSALVRNDEGIIENTGFEKQSVRINLQKQVGVADVSVNTNVLHTLAGRGITNNDNRQVSYYMVFANIPSFIDLRQNSDGTFPRTPSMFVPPGSNPLQTAALVTNDEDVWRLISSGNVDLSLVDGERHGFNVIVNGGVDWFGQKNEILSPPEAHFESADGLLGTSLLTNSDNLNLNVNANAVWTYQPNDGFTATTSGGVQYERRDLELARIIGKNLTGGKPNVDAGTQISVRERTQVVEDFGFYVQEEILTLDERLLLTGAVRFDQTSANGDDEELFLYPKASASYRIPELGGFLDEVKLRGAFGQTGNQPLFGQEFTELLTDRNIEGIPGFVIEGTVGGADIEPERQTEIEGGVDVTAWNGRATLEATGYYQRISNLILQAQTAPSTGFEDRFLNGGELRNIGVELALGLTPLRSPDLTWVSRASFFLNRSEVLELETPAFEPDPGFGLDLGSPYVQEGESATQIAGTAGVDAEGNAIIETLGDTEPDFSVGFTNDLTVGAFELYSLLDWRVGQDVVNLTELLYDLSGNAIDHVDQDGEISEPRECGSFGGRDCSGEERFNALVTGFAHPYTQSASFLKLRELSLSYTLPESARRQLFGGAFETVRLRLSGRDLFTITPYDGLDPEVSNFGNQQIGRSIDVAPFPPSRSFWFGVDVTL